MRKVCDVSLSCVLNSKLDLKNEVIKLFEGSYQECVDKFNEVKGEYVTRFGDPLEIRIYPESHKSIEYVWEYSRLFLRAWEPYNPSGSEYV